MAYIGTPPSNAFTSLLKQDFSTSATTGYTLDHAVNNANDIALFINFVRQEPTAAYSASGTTLTLTSATASSDDMYCVYLGQALQTVNPPNASVGASQIVDASITSGKLASGVLPDNTPAWSAKRSSAQTGIANNTSVLIICDSEELDTDNAYNTSTGIFTVPSGKGGRYMVGAAYRTNGSGASTRIATSLFVGSNTIRQTNFNQVSSGEATGACHAVLNLSAGDEISFKIFQNSGSAINAEADGKTYFYGYKIIE